jgi:hypothetical protein
MDLIDAFYIECLASGLKESIRAHVHMQYLVTWLEACQRALKAKTMLNAQPNHSCIMPCTRKDPNTHTT